MTRRNRVLPTGEIVAHPARGLFMGNRGCLHDAAGEVVRERTSQRFWITCVTAFKGRRRELMTPGHYTELFFLDEAVALAAGHRPCAECRRADFNRFREAWAQAFWGGGSPRAPEMDMLLAAARRDSSGRQITQRARLGGLPDGVFVDLPGVGPALRHEGVLHPFQPAGYGDPLPPPADADVTVLTPTPTVAVLAAGYRPLIHPSAARGG